MKTRVDSKGYGVLITEHKRTSVQMNIQNDGITDPAWTHTRHPHEAVIFGTH